MSKNHYLLFFIAGLLALALFNCSKRKPQEIDLAPNSPFNPYPPDSSTNIDHTTLDVTLSWTATDPNSGQALTYDVYLDTINPPIYNKIATGLASPNYFMTGLVYNTTYYWKIYITDSKGAITSGPIWQFTTLPHANKAPNTPIYNTPADNATWQYPTLNFAVTGSDTDGVSDTLHYDLYLGITPQPPVISYKNDTASSREISGLNYTTTYYWKVVVHDNHYAYNYGPGQSFTTRDCPWFYKREMPSPRYGFGTVVVNDKIYVIGGTDSRNYLSEVLEYDPWSDTWTRKTDMPTPRSGLAVTVWNGKIYALGGQNNAATCRNNEVYSPLSDSWSALTPLPQENYAITAQVVNGKIYTMGGDYKLGYVNGGIFEYDIATDDWWDTIITDTIHYYAKSLMPTDRFAVCSALYNGDIYLFGGAPLNSMPTSIVDIYHPESNSWSTAAPMIGPANFPAAITTGSIIYVLGGYENNYLRRIRKYDPVANTWFIRGDMQDGRSSFGAAFTNNRIYAFGGTGLFPLGTMEEYRPDLDPKNIGR